MVLSHVHLLISSFTSMSMHDSTGDDDANALANVGVLVVRLLNFYKNWSKVEFPTNLRNKAAPPPPGGHPSTTTWNPHFYLLFFLLAGGWYWYFLLVLESRGVEANTDAVC